MSTRLWASCPPGIRKPQREVGGGDPTAEVWLAPSVQFLPVRMLLRQDADTWIELTSRARRCRQRQNQPHHSPGSCHDPTNASSPPRKAPARAAPA